jgi:hypothetical protein
MSAGKVTLFDELPSWPDALIKEIVTDLVVKIYVAFLLFMGRFLLLLNIVYGKTSMYLATEGHFHTVKTMNFPIRMLFSWKEVSQIM